MKIHFYLTLLTALLACTASFAQSSQDANITITVDGQETELEVYIEELAEHIEKAASKLEDIDLDVHFNYDDEEFEASISNLVTSLEQYGEELGKAIEKAVRHMSIELKDLEPEEIRKGNTEINDVALNDILDEIERKYNSDIEHIDRLYLKLNDDKVLMEMDLILENGKEIRNYRKTY